MEVSLVQAKTHPGSVHQTNQQNTDGLVTPEIALRADSLAMSESGHFAQFYEADEFLLHSLSEFIGAGLSAGEAGIVVATPEHRAGLDALLQQRGLDVAAA